MGNEAVDVLLEQLKRSGPIGEEAHRFLVERRVRVRLQPQSTGARWMIGGRIDLNPTQLADQAYALSLIVHEVRHLRQGVVRALSVLGELEAWQEQFSFLKSLTGRYAVSPTAQAAIEEMMMLSPTLRADLQRARSLMLIYAGPGYYVRWLPLWPLGQEIRFWVSGRRAVIAPRAKETFRDEGE